MGLYRVRVNGQWVDTEVTGAIRVNGTTIEFGPEEPPVDTYEAFNYPALPLPQNRDLSDGGQAYQMGTRFHLLAPKSCFGVQWLVPNSVANPPGGTHHVTLWDSSDESMLAYKAFTPVPGDFQDILFDTPVSLVAAPTQYVVAVYTTHYVFRAPEPVADWTLTSPSGNLRGDRSQLAAWSSGEPLFPGGNFAAWYYVSPLMGT